MDEQETLEKVNDIKKVLKMIFNYYASYGDRMNMHNLKSTKFHKIMSDSNILETGRNALVSKK
jgi:hypothetical protein